MSCTHTNTVKVGEFKVCIRCGYTMIPGRKPFFDKEITNYKKERKKNVKNR